MTLYREGGLVPGLSLPGSEFAHEPGLVRLASWGLRGAAPPFPAAVPEHVCRKRGCPPVGRGLFADEIALRRVWASAAEQRLDASSLVVVSS